MKRTLSIILALCLMLSCAVFFGGCASSKNKDFPVVFGDVTIEEEPKAIVVLNDDLADIISYIGYDIKMVGRAQECDQEFLHVVPTMGSAVAPDTDAIIAAGTDLVIADSSLNANVKNTLNAAKINVVTLDPATNEDDLKTLYVNLGTVLGGNTTGNKKGEDGYNKLFEMLNTLTTATPDIVQSAAYLYLDGEGKLCTFVKGTLEYKFFNYNGCSNVLLNQETPVVDTAELKIDSPTYLFYDSPDVLNALKADPNTAGLDVLTNEKSLLIEKKQFYRHGPSAEAAVYKMLNFIEKDIKGADKDATPDYTPTTGSEKKEPTAAASTTAPASSSPASSKPASSKPASSSEEEVITFADPDTN